MECGADNTPQAVYGECRRLLGAGAALGPERKGEPGKFHLMEIVPPEDVDGERKNPTALFADIKGSNDASRAHRSVSA
jgi:class 3 adenylate cyclase